MLKGLAHLRTQFISPPPEQALAKATTHTLLRMKCGFAVAAASMLAATGISLNFLLQIREASNLNDGAVHSNLKSAPKLTVK